MPIHGFEVNLKFELWPLSFEFVLFTYLDSFRATIQATSVRISETKFTSPQIASAAR